MSKIQPFSPAPPPSTYSTSAGSIKHHGGKPYTGADASRSIEEPGGRSSKSDEAMRFLSDRIADLESRAREEKLVQRVGELETKYLDVRALEGVLGKLLQRMDALEQARAADAAQVEADRLAHQNLQGEVAKIEDDLNKRCLGEDGLEGVVEKLGGRMDELEQARAADAAQVETGGETAGETDEEVDSLTHQKLKDLVREMRAALGAQSGELQSMPEAQQREIAPEQQQEPFGTVVQAICTVGEYLQAHDKTCARLATWAAEYTREQVESSEAATRGALIMTEELGLSAINARFHESELKTKCLGEDGLEGVVEKLGGRVDELEQARAADAAQVETDGEAASLAHQNLQDEVAKMQAALDAQSGELQSMPEAQQREIAPGQQQTSLEAIAQAIGVMYDHLQANQRSYAHLATWAVQRDREQLGCVSEAVTRGVLIMTEALERNAFNARFHESELSVRSKELEARLVEQLARLDTRLGAALQAAEAKNVKLEAALEAQHREIEQLKSVCSSLAAPDHSAEAVEFVLLGEGEKE